MNASEILAEIIGTRAVCGHGVGSSVEEWDSGVSVDFLDVGREPPSDMFRRDYGLIEVIFTGGDPWRCDSFGVQVHRLAYHPEIMTDWMPAGSSGLGSVAWADVLKSLGGREDAPTWIVGRQGDMVQYMSHEAGISVFVCDDDADEQDDLPRPGDIWSIMVGPPGPQACSA